MIDSPDGAESRALRDKLSRLRDGAPPRVLDLFSGCGGLSLGAHRAGCEIVGAVEIDRHAAASHAYNFHAGSRVHAAERDITKIKDPSKLLSEFGIARNRYRRAIDILVGAPPCQAFARVGRAKLREIANHPTAHLHDERSGLYSHYLKFVEALRPVAIVMENVPDVLNFGGANVFEMIAESLAAAGYDCAYTLLNAAHYGVPQMRSRSFLIGISRLAEAEPTIPTPTHRHNLPLGYSGTNSVAVRKVCSKGHRFRQAPEAAPELPSAVSAHQAIGDLPRLTRHLEVDLRKRPQRFKDPIRSPRRKRISEFASSMRDWPRFGGSDVLFDHVIRRLPRDYKIFARMKEGDQYPEALSIAEQMFFDVLAASSSPPKPGSRAYRELKATIVPPYDANKFPNKWRKMERDEPARTLMAHLGKDSYSHIHYDSAQARTISVREAARLQSFPDGFAFSGTMNPAFCQIGNAVPPLLAFAVIRQVLTDLRARSTARQSASACS